MVESTETTQLMELTEEQKKLQALHCANGVIHPPKQESWWLKNRGKVLGGALAITGIGLLVYGIYSYFKNKKEDKTEDENLQKQGIAKAKAVTDKSSDTKTTESNQKSTDAKIPGTNITVEPKEYSQQQMAVVTQKAKANG